MTRSERSFGYLQLGKSVKLYVGSQTEFGFLIGDDNQLFPIKDKSDFINYLSDWFDSIVNVQNHYCKSSND